MNGYEFTSGVWRMDMKHTWLAMALLVGAAGVATAADLAAQQKAQQLCAGCHGPDGHALNPLWPNLAGQNAPYLAKALTDYKSGVRPDPVMQPLAGTLTDAEIQALAVWYARQ